MVSHLDVLPPVPSVLSFEAAPDGTVQVRDGDTTVGVLNINPADEMALIPAQNDAAFRAALQGEGKTPQSLTQIDGVNYSSGDQIALTLYRIAP